MVQLLLFCKNGFCIQKPAKVNIPLEISEEIKIDDYQLAFKLRSLNERCCFN